MKRLALTATLAGLAGFAAYLAARGGPGAAYSDLADPTPPAEPDLAPVAPDPGTPAVTAFDWSWTDMPKMKTWSIPLAGQQYAEQIARAESVNGLPAGLLARLLFEESRYRQDIITGATRSPVGAVGIAQFMPATAKDLNVDPLDPASAIPGAGRYLKQLYAQLGSWDRTLAAYNWGVGNVKRKGLERAPAETRAYVANITNDIGLS